MKVLLDEDVPEPLILIVQHLLRGHQVDHVSKVGWKGKSDENLFKDARVRGYGAVVTANIGQFNDPSECDAIKKSRVHHVSYELVESGLKGLGLASGAICAAIRPILDELEQRDRQHIVRIQSLSSSKRRFKITDPAKEPPSRYWR